MGQRQARCRLTHLGDVQVIERQTTGPEPETSLHLTNVVTCGNRLCALCFPAEASERAAEISCLLDGRHHRAAFVSLTVRHQPRWPLALLRRALIIAYRDMFSGKYGQKFKAALGGEVDTVRTHDETWSPQVGWHPHLHAIWVFPERCPAALQSLVDERWRACVAAAMRKLRRASYAATFRTEGWESAWTQTFGKGFTKGLPGDIPSPEYAAEVNELLHGMDLTPSKAHGVHCEPILQAGRMGNYMAKLGLEMTHPAGKPYVDERGHAHYSLWELGLLCTDKDREKSRPARAAWAELYRASFGQSHLRWSRGMREKYAINPDSHAKPPELERCLGTVPSEQWKTWRKELGPRLLEALHQSWDRGELEQYLHHLGGVSAVFRDKDRRVDHGILRTPLEAANRHASYVERGRGWWRKRALKAASVEHYDKLSKREQVEELLHVLLDANMITRARAMGRRAASGEE